MDSFRKIGFSDIRNTSRGRKQELKYHAYSSEMEYFCCETLKCWKKGATLILPLPSKQAETAQRRAPTACANPRRAPAAVGKTLQTGKTPRNAQ
jgi:hypothetical protein